MDAYLRLLRRIKENGEIRHNRTGIDTIEVYGEQFVHNMADGFPLLTTKKVAWKSMLRELLWFLAGDTNVKHLEDQGCKIWTPWRKQGTDDLGPIYGSQWRKWTTVDAYGKPVVVDQVAELIDKIRNNPTDRRMIVTAWHPGQLQDMALPPCHWNWEVYWHNDGTLDLTWTQRSVDAPVGEWLAPVA